MRIGSRLRLDSIERLPSREATLGNRDGMGLEVLRKKYVIMVWCVLAIMAAMSTLRATAATDQAERAMPNILLILADDLGYGDVSCYNDQAKVATPNLDRLAAQGMRFTDAHSAATVCTPSRYSIMTGRMCFRTGFRGVFVGIGGPCLIESGRLTLPQMLREKGYATAMFGKWHMGLTFLDRNGERVGDSGVDGIRQVDFSRAISDAPIHRGFDTFLGTACCPTTDWLYAFIDGDRVPVPPSMTRIRNRNTLPQHPYSNDCRPGLIASDFDLEEVDLVFLQRSQRFMRQQVRQHPDQPFFLFHSMQAVHLPSFAADRFKGASNAGPHGDFIHEMDWVVGRLMDTLDELGIAENTLVMFGSDNGPEVPTVNAMRRDHRHDGARPWRGVKRDDWEGGHRTPFIVRWPGRVKARSISDEPLSHTDIFATCAAIVGAALPDAAAEDSFNMLPVLLGEPRDEPVRPYLLEQTMSLAFSIRRGNWKLLDHRGSGGNDYTREEPWGMKAYALPELEPDAPAQLYNLTVDPGETTNLYGKHPQIAAELKQLLEQTKASGRSRP
jgi:arylsulfatase A